MEQERQRVLLSAIFFRTHFVFTGVTVAVTNSTSIFGQEALPKREVSTLQTLKSAAEQGSDQAQLRLGELYQIGKGIPKDDIQAYAWIIIGTAQSDSEEGKEFLVWLIYSHNHRVVRYYRFRFFA